LERLKSAKVQGRRRKRRREVGDVKPVRDLNAMALSET